MASPIDQSRASWVLPPLSPDSSDRSDALPCPIVPLAVQTVVGTANSRVGKMPTQLNVGSAAS